MSKNVEELKNLVGTTPKSDVLVRAFHEALSFAAIIVGPSSATIYYVNKAAELMTGYLAHQLRGQHINVLVPDAQKSAHLELTDGYLAQPNVLLLQRRMAASVSVRLRRRDGAEVPAVVELCPLQTEEGLFVVATVKPGAS
jgi:PAS domain S-box-containing protein